MTTSVSKTLRNLARNEAFFFFASVGNYVGKSAASLREFLKEIGEVNTKVLEFHLYRRDFEKWIKEVLEDAKLAKQIGNIRDLNLIGESLRSQLRLVISKRYIELKRESSETKV